MTVRDYILRRARVGFVLIYGGMALVVAALAFAPDIANILVPLAIVMTTVGSVIANLFVRCPKCRGNLALVPLRRRRIWGRSANFCQYCSVSLDSPWSAKT